MKKFAAAILAGILASAQQQQPPAATPDGGVTKISATFQMVIETITVNDKNGKAIEGLRAEDFTVTENGTPQKIQFLEFQKLPLAGDPAPDFATRPDPAAPPKRPVTKVASVTGAQIAPEPAGDLHYRNKRLLALYFD